MANIKGTILVVGEAPDRRRRLEELLSEEGYETESALSGDAALRRIDEKGVDLFLCDIGAGEISPLDLLRKVRAIDPNQAVVMIAPPEKVASAIEAMKGGAFDYIIEPYKAEALIVAVQKAFDRTRLQKEVVRLRQAVSREHRFSNIIGKSKEMGEVFQLIRRVAKNTVNILIAGESGTGKEIVAKAIHYNSARKDHPFVAVNCAAIPETLLESELFGHVRGAFTDARSDKKGMFEEAHGGTLLLDEIGEIPMSLQPKLLRAIEEKAVRRVGGVKTIPVDIRILSSTNQDLMEEVKAKRFRDDLYYRINVLEIHLPPLRGHREDIPLLADHFLKKFAGVQRKEISGFTESAMNILMNHVWPGNVRELENVIERGVTLARGEKISAEDFPPALTGRHEDQLLLDRMLAKMVPLAEMEREYIERVLQWVGGNKLRAAQILQIDRKTLYRKLDHDPRREKEEKILES